MLKATLLAVLLGVFALPIYAWEDEVDVGDNVRVYDIVSLDQNDMGNVYAHIEDEDLIMDFDFDEPRACEVEKIRADFESNKNDLPRNEWGLLEPSEFEFLAEVGYRSGPSYVDPRDAVLYFDADWRENQAVALTVEFDCGNRSVLAFVGNEAVPGDPEARFFWYDTGWADDGRGGGRDDNDSSDTKVRNTYKKVKTTVTKGAETLSQEAREAARKAEIKWDEWTAEERERCDTTRKQWWIKCQIDRIKNR